MGNLDLVKYYNTRSAPGASARCSDLASHLKKKKKRKTPWSKESAPKKKKKKRKMKKKSEGKRIKVSRRKLCVWDFKILPLGKDRAERSPRAG